MRSGIPFPLAALSAVGAIAFSILPAHAAKVPASQSNDIFIGFRSAEDPGSSFAYLVKIGTYNTFRDVPEGGSITVNTLTVGGNPVSIGNLGADLSALGIDGKGFGPNWYNRENVHWGVFGWGSVNNPVLFVSRHRPSVTVPSSPWDELNSTQRNVTYTHISSVLTSGASAETAYDLLDATPNSPVAAFQPSGSGTYKDKIENGSTDFGPVSGWTSIEASFANGPANALLDFYRISNGAGGVSPVFRVGYFSISSSGVLIFTKPSTGPNPNDDDDGDGFTNGEEDLAGTNPNDPNDFFRVQSVLRTSGNALISFKPVAGRTYVLRYSETLQPPWEDIAVWPAGTTPPSLHTFTDNDPVRTAKPRGFYRIVVSQP